MYLGLFWSVCNSHLSLSLRWMQEELPSSVASRSPPHLTQSELVRLVKWKLARGKFRPRLVEFAASNEEELVKKVTGESLKVAEKCKKGKEEEALKILGEERDVCSFSVGSV